MLKKILYYVLAFFTILPGMDWLWEALNIQSPSKIWAMSLTTVFLMIFLGLNYCTYQHQILIDRLKDCAEAKAKLEKTFIKKRRTSKK